MTFPSSVCKKRKRDRIHKSADSEQLLMPPAIWPSLLVIAIDSTTKNQKPKNTSSTMQANPGTPNGKRIARLNTKSRMWPKKDRLRLQCSMRKIGDNGVSSTYSAMFLKGSWEFPAVSFRLLHRITRLCYY